MITLSYVLVESEVSCANWEPSRYAVPVEVLNVNSILYHVSVDKAELSDPICANPPTALFAQYSSVPFELRRISCSLDPPESVTLNIVVSPPGSVAIRR